MQHSKIFFITIFTISSLTYANETLRTPQKGINTFVLTSLITEYTKNDTALLPQHINKIYRYSTGIGNCKYYVIGIETNDKQEIVLKIEENKKTITYQRCCGALHNSYSKEDFKTDNDAKDRFAYAQELINTIEKQPNQQ